VRVPFGPEHQQEKEAEEDQPGTDIEKETERESGSQERSGRVRAQEETRIHHEKHQIAVDDAQVRRRSQEHGRVQERKDDPEA
jgi:hypothetical protein